jgi:hypothetical protein
MSSNLLCQNAADAAPGCVGIADARYTMDFSDVKPGAKIYWCEVCGPVAHEFDKRLNEALKTRPGFAKKLREAIDDAKEKDAMGRLTTLNDPKRCETCIHFIEEEGDCEKHPREPGGPPCIDIWTCISWEGEEPK